MLANSTRAKKNTPTAYNVSMNDPSNRSGSSTGLVIGIVLLLLALPCCGGLALLGMALVGYRSVERPRQPQVIVQPAAPLQPPVLVPDDLGREEPAEASVPMAHTNP